MQGSEFNIRKEQKMEESGQTHVQEIKYAARMPNRKYAYFRDDQIVLLLKHNEHIIVEDELNQLRAAIDEAIGERRTGLAEKPLEMITFQPLTDEEIKLSSERLDAAEVDNIKSAFSIIRRDLNNPTINLLDGTTQDPADLLTLIKQFPEKLNGIFKDKGITAFTLESAIPNWLTSIASQSGGTGGPGGRPFPYYGNRKTAPYQLDIINQLVNANGGSLYGDGSGVDVVILDTAPCAQDLVVAYKEWPDHPLISTLLGPAGKLHLYPASYEDNLRMSCTSLNDHDYKMTDHGLFIAGIIHSIVPEAEIHLIEVLNQFGVGDFTSFIQGFQKIYDEKIYRPDRKLVINCSWMFEFPREDRHCRHMNQNGDPDSEFEKKVREFSKDDQSLLHTLENFFTRFYGLGRQAMAAAGNDNRKEDTDRVAARYPAALRRVTGIGAQPKTLDKDANNKYIPSVFSNVADTPEKKGIVTLGGEEGEGKGVLGLYIGEFPGCCRNESKWAWWAGTSFATPIMTGAVASVLSRVDTNSTQAAIDKLYGLGAKIIKEGQVERQQSGLPVIQG